MKRWTQKEKVLLLTLIQRGLKPKEIAQEMNGRTTSAVFNQIYGSKAAHAHYQDNKHKRDYIRAVRKVPAETSVRTAEAKEDNSVVYNLSEIASVTSAVFSFATFLLVVGALLA